MRLYKMFGVWMFEKQTEEEEEEEEVIFQRDNREYWCALRNQKPLVIDQFQLQEPKTIFKLFICMLCNSASNAKPLISIYRVFGLI